MGIGKEGNEGITAPVAMSTNDAHLGLGKAAQYSIVIAGTAVETSEKRRRLEDNRDAQTLTLRQEAEKKLERRAAEMKVELAAFYCDCCDKQYSNVTQWTEHLASYAHTHTRNMKALRAAEADRRKAAGGLTREEKRSKEARREARALKRRMAATTTAVGGGGMG